MEKTEEHKFINQILCKRGIILNMETQFENKSSLNDLQGTDANKLEYIKGMIIIAREDIKIVMLYITLALGIIVLFLTQISIDMILALCLYLRILVLAGIVLLSASAFCFFLYIRNLHITQMKMTRCLASLDSLRTRELWAGKTGVWQKHGYKYRMGRFLIVCGTLCFGIVLFYIIVLNSSQPQ